MPSSPSTVVSGDVCRCGLCCRRMFGFCVLLRMPLRAALSARRNHLTLVGRSLVSRLAKLLPHVCYCGLHEVSCRLNFVWLMQKKVTGVQGIRNGCQWVNVWLDTFFAGYFKWKFVITCFWWNGWTLDVINSIICICTSSTVADEI